MSANFQPQLDAIAFQLVAAVESYEQQVEALLATWPDMERYGGVSESINAIRRYAAALPPVSVQFVALLIAHTELVHVLWKPADAGGGDDDLALHAAREQHRHCAAALRIKCKGLLLARTESSRND